MSRFENQFTHLMLGEHRSGLIGLLVIGLTFGVLHLSFWLSGDCHPGKSDVGDFLPFSPPCAHRTQKNGRDTHSGKKGRKLFFFVFYRVIAPGFLPGFRPVSSPSSPTLLQTTGGFLPQISFVLR